MPFLHDPDRYLVAFASACIMAGFSEKQAFRAAARFRYAKVVPFDAANSEVVWLTDEMVCIPGVPADIESVATRIRKKWQRKDRKDRPLSSSGEPGYTVKETTYIVAMSLAWSMALFPGASGTAGLIRTVAATVGEDGYAQRVLVPVFLSRQRLRPDFSPPPAP